MTYQENIDILSKKLEKFINFKRKNDVAQLKSLINESAQTQIIGELENRINSEMSRLNFVAKILSADKKINPKLEAFEKLIYEDYKDFASQVSVKEEVVAFTIFKEVQQELTRLLSLHDIANKSIVAVGGGFSAGKSQFINSFFSDSNIKLPTGVKPVTAIATYIIHGSKHLIKGYTHRGGVVEIPVELYGQLSHNFIKELGFNLKTILPMMAMETSMPEYEKICFVDTPGYNPPSEGQTALDRETASEFLLNANSLIWLVGLDTNGTIPESDLEFLSSLNLENKKLYFVASKADQKSPSDLEDILDTFEGVLDDYGLEYAGISAYNSKAKTELMFRKIGLKDFLSSTNHGVISKDEISNNLNKAFLIYKNELTQEKEKQAEISKTLNALELDIIESGNKFSDDLQSRLDSLNSFIDTKLAKKQLESLEVLRKKLFLALDDVIVEIFGSKLDKWPDFKAENILLNKENVSKNTTKLKRKFPISVKAGITIFAILVGAKIIGSTYGELSESKKTIARLESQISNLEQSQKSTEYYFSADLNQKDDQIESLSTQNNELFNANTNLNTQLDERIQENSTLSEKNIFLNEQLTQKLEENNNLIETNEVLKEELNKKLQEISDLRLYIDELKNQTNFYQNSNNQNSSTQSQTQNRQIEHNAMSFGSGSGFNAGQVANEPVQNKNTQSVDDEINEVYKTFMNSLSQNDQEFIRNTQRHWIKYRASRVKLVGLLGYNSANEYDNITKKQTDFFKTIINGRYAPTDTRSASYRENELKEVIDTFWQGVEDDEARTEFKNFLSLWSVYRENSKVIFSTFGLRGDDFSNKITIELTEFLRSMID